MFDTAISNSALSCDFIQLLFCCRISSRVRSAAKTWLTASRASDVSLRMPPATTKCDTIIIYDTSSMCVVSFVTSSFCVLQSLDRSAH